MSHITNIAPLFDEALLTAHHESQIRHFEGKIFGHPHFEQSHARATDSINIGAAGKLSVLMGPSGVGTSQLGRAIWRAGQREGHAKNPVPQASVNANSIGVGAPIKVGRIDKDYLASLLGSICHQGGDILVDKKLYVPPNEFTLSHSIPMSTTPRGGLENMISITADLLNRRKTKVVLINQAHRMFPVGDPESGMRSQQMLIDLAALTQTRIMLISSYEPLMATQGCSDWLATQDVIHLRRYDYSVKEEYTAYVAAVVFILGHIPSPLRLKAIAQEFFMELYLNTVGCIGTAKRIILGAFKHAQNVGKAMTEDLLRNYFLDNVIARKIALVAVAGEQTLTDIDPSEIEVILSKKGDAANESRGGDSEKKGKVVKTSNQASTGSSGIHKRRIGERRSTRDPVGVPHAARG